MPSYCMGNTDQAQNSPPSNCPSVVSSTLSYFRTIPVIKFTEAGLPCLLIHLENRTLLAELDLGFRGNISFSKGFLDQIDSKKYIRSKKMFGLKGREYTTKIYQVPFIKLGGAAFSDPILHEENEDFLNDASIVTKGDQPSPHEPCRIGWEIFQGMGLLLDLGNSQIALSNSISTVKKRKYPKTHFIEVDLNTDRGLVEIKATTDTGRVLCVLDTGSTWNLINQEIKEGLEIEDEDNTYEFADFKFDQHSVGPIIFHRIPISLPIHIEAMLGMEFFQSHIVFLDFPRHKAYIALNKK